MKVHKPASLPLRARIKPTLNLRPAVRGKTIEYNQTARRIVDYLHARILENPDESQTYLHEDVGAALGIDPQKVRLSLAHAGVNRTAVEVTSADRAAIKRLLRSKA